MTRNSYQWQRLRKRRLEIAEAIDEHCSWCGGPVDYSLLHQRGMANRPGYAIVNHIRPLSEGGELIVPLEELDIHHKRCSSQEGAQQQRRATTANERGYRVKPVTTHSDGRGRGSEPATASARTLEQKPRSEAGFLSTDASDSGAREKSTYGASPSPDSAPPRLTVVEPHPDGPMSPPRFVSPPHPRAVRSLFPEVEDWIADVLEVELRPWQRLVLDRLLEVDADDRLVWTLAVISTPRQQGKGWLISVLACVRQHLGAKYGWGTQEITHVARDLAAARRIMMIPDRVKWAQAFGIGVRTGFGNERWLWPDGDEWRLASLSGVYGSSAGLVLLDETWDIRREVLYEALLPTVVERECPQIVMLSTAHREATALTLELRRDAIAGSDTVFIAEWSAPDGADHSDPAAWRSASAHWSSQREGLMRMAMGRPGFAEQWLNRWPGESQTERDPWPLGLPACPRTPGVEPQVVVVEAASTPGVYGVVRAAKDPEGRIHLQTRRHFSLEAAAADAQSVPGVPIIAGMSIAGQVPSATPWGQKQTGRGTAYFAEAVAAGRVLHDHTPDLLDESMHAFVASTEAGLLLSARRSTGPIPLLKGAVWAVLYLDFEAVARPVIW